MTLEGELNRPNATTDEVVDELDELNAIADQALAGGDIELDDHEDHQDQDGQVRERAPETNQVEQLLQNDIFSQTIDQINASLSSIQQDINTLTVRGEESAATEASLGQLYDRAFDEELDEDELDNENIQEIDKNLDKISEALDKLDSENDDLQGRLRELLEAIRAGNNSSASSQQ